MAKTRTRRKPRVIRVTDGELERVLELLHQTCGLDFAHYKTPTIVRRLVRRMTLSQSADVEAYIAHLEDTPEEILNLHSDLLIRVTRFFREPGALAALAKHVLPSFEIGPNATVRAWVAGCATGEEAYSVAMLMHEAFGEGLAKARVQIFGTDVDQAAIEYARRGLYPASIAGDVSPERLRRFFTETNGGYMVAEALRDMCSFVRHDLTGDPPLSQLDVICCRNVLIYMSPPLQQRLLSQFHHSLKPQGVLVLGQAESLGRNSRLLAPVDKKRRIFRKTREADAAASRKRHTDTQAAARDGAARRVRQPCAPTSTLVEKPKRAIKHADRTHAGRRRGAKTGRIARLEEEVTVTREYLQSTIQEIEAANEELQAANEAILSSNEELQRTNEELDTAKEELQSSNVELSLLNDELIARNEELTRVNTDLLSLLETVPIAVVIVSRDLRIRRFTPIAEQVFQLLPRDIGRSFTQTGQNVVSPELLPMVAEVIDTDTAIERTVRDAGGRSRSLRIRPCKDADGRVEGAVIALFEQAPVGG